MAINLPAELARKAAQGGMGQAASSASGAGGGKPAPGGWVVPVFPEGFSVDEAVEKAMGVAGYSMNYVLQHEGVVVSVQQAGVESRAEVTEKGSQKVIKAYDGMDFLRLYAGQEQRRGVVVDGGV